MSFAISVVRSVYGNCADFAYHPRRSTDLRARIFRGQPLANHNAIEQYINAREIPRDPFVLREYDTRHAHYQNIGRTLMQSSTRGRALELAEVGTAYRNRDMVQLKAMIKRALVVNGMSPTKDQVLTGVESVRR